MSANERQVGGDHYKTGGLEVWDLFGPEFLIGSAVRYIARWRKKNGVQDLEEGLHFVEKLREVAPQFRANTYSYAVDDVTIESWMCNAGLNHPEQTIVRNLLFWWRVDYALEYAIAGINYLIAGERAKPKPHKTAGSVGVVAVHEKFKKESLGPDRRVPRYESGGLIKGPGQTEFSAGTRVKDEEATRQINEPRPPWEKMETCAGCGKTGEHNEVTTWWRDVKGDVYHLECRPRDDLAPWQIDGRTYKEWSAGNAVRHAALIAFYKQVTRDLYRLEPHARSKHVPAELRACYALRPKPAPDGIADEWVIRIERVPPVLRECYPNLRRKVNAVEYDQLPAWQRALYLSRHGGGYELSAADNPQAWHYEENEGSQ